MDALATKDCQVYRPRNSIHISVGLCNLQIVATVKILHRHKSNGRVATWEIRITELMSNSENGGMKACQMPFPAHSLKAISYPSPVKIVVDNE